MLKQPEERFLQFVDNYFIETRQNKMLSLRGH